LRSVIDVHAHILPPDYVAAMRAAGLTDRDGHPLADGTRFPAWSLEDSLAIMDRHDIAASVLSVTAPGVQFVAGDSARRLARAMNEAMLEIVRQHPARFAILAVLPLSDIDASLQEIDYAFANGADGIGLYSNVDGRYLGDPRFTPLFEELDRRGATVFVHPAKPAAAEDLGIGLSAPILEYPFDSTRMLTSLLYSGTLARCRRMKLIVPHGGGAIPYLAARVASAAPRFSRIASSAEAIALLQGVYYDLTAMGQDCNLALLADFLPADRILVGYDYPFRPESVIAPHVREFEAFAGFSIEEKARIRQGNALRLFPRLQQFAKTS
jgi:predicted TIM-barrel fold metal-dependent hydrolase